MNNSKQIEPFVLAVYVNTGDLKYLYFTLALVLYIMVIFTNIILIVTICMERKLHEPMYLFLCSLFANEVYGSTAFLPCVMVQILSETHEISYVCCFIQIFSMHSYAIVEYANLTVMAYDRYVCICLPLHYHMIMNMRKVRIVILMVWVFSFVEVGILLSFTLRLKLCGNIINRLFCENHSVSVLACSLDHTFSGIRDFVFGLTFTVTLPVIFILISYIKILSVCLWSSKETKQKAISTCTPHLTSLINFVLGCFYALISQRFDNLHVPYALHVFTAIYGMVVQPLLSPIMYGLKLSNMRDACTHFLSRKAIYL